jgi:hypothetical protein
MRTWSQHTILLYTFGALHTHRAPSPWRSIMPASTLVVQGYRAPGTAWADLLSCGLRGLFRSLWRRFCRLREGMLVLRSLTKRSRMYVEGMSTHLGGRLGRIRFLGGCGLWGRCRVRAIVTAAANTCYDVCLARHQGMLICWSLVMLMETRWNRQYMHTASETARSDETRTESLMSCMMTCFSDQDM